jgi:RHH-type proline utilization regulon transcriptional repressor/proline dehydrogenase/delta 1-pyrroline-5-carboxylate dehydrogenase
MAELRVGRTDALRSDIGPVITNEAKANILGHVEAMRAAGHKVRQLPLGAETVHGSFVPPTIIEIGAVAELTREVFGPVLHVLRYRADALDALVDAINATGYGLTFGLHTRLDATIERVTRRIRAGNLYVNRNIIGAVVGVQPFGGRGLSGTGPKAGGPLYLTRLVANPAKREHGLAEQPSLAAFTQWLEAQGAPDAAERARAAGRASPCGLAVELAGPVGERNVYTCHPRGRLALYARTQVGLWDQLAATLATGNRAMIAGPHARPEWLAGLPASVAGMVEWSADWATEPDIAAALVEQAGDVAAVAAALASREGTIVPLQLAAPDGYVLDWLVEEVATSINTAAAGGNASLMAIG